MPVLGCAQLLDLDKYQPGGTADAGGGGPAPGTVLWAKLYGDAEAQVPHALAVSDDGAVLFAGALDGRIELGCCEPLTADADPFIAAVDVDGNGLWGQVFSASNAASIDSFWPAGASIWFGGSFDTNVNVAGNTLAGSDSDAFFGSVVGIDGMVLDASAMMLADVQLHTRVAVDQYARVAVAMETVVAGSTDILVRAFHDNGAVRWEKTFPSPADEEVHAVGVDPNGHVIVAGSVGDVIDFGCQPHQASDIDGFLVKLEYVTGNCIWSLELGGPGVQRVHGLAIDEAGDVVVVGEFEGEIRFGSDVEMAEQGSIDAFVARLDQAGKYRWHKTSGGAGSERGAHAVITGAGRIAVAGDFNKALGFDDRTVNDDLFDGFVLLLENDGALRWSAHLAGGGDQRFMAVAGQGERVFALAEMSADAKLGGWYLVNQGALPSIGVAALVE
ncbi:MAG TPA: hypothetical protein VFB62_15295 [Polyangiaceae bacterium]|nr:hypothetical protein [Polyangiaceae bacterium]